MSRTLLFTDQPPEPGPDKPRPSAARGLVLVVLIFVATRLVVWTGAYLGATVVFCIRHQWEPPLNQHLSRFKDQPIDEDSVEYRSAMELLGDFAPLSQFDGLNYKSIITGGYDYQRPPPDAKPTEWQQNIAFFPLYPLLCRSLTGVMTPEAAMILLGHLFALAAAIVLYLWVRRRVDEATALWAVALTFCFPAACYYSFAYAESLTLLLLVLALWLMDRRSFLAAAVVCGLATAVRPTTAAIVPVFMLAYWLGSTDAPGRRLIKLAPLSLLAVGGGICYAAYLTWRFGSPLVYMDNFQAGWVSAESRADWLEFLTLAPIWSQLQRLGLVFAAFPAGLVELADPLGWNMPLSLFVIVLSLVGLRHVPRSFRPLLCLAPLIFLHAYAASGGAHFGLDPLTRYLAVAVPTLIVLAAWARRSKRPGAYCALVAFMLLLQAAWAFRFGLREWSG